MAEKAELPKAGDMVSPTYRKESLELALRLNNAFDVNQLLAAAEAIHDYIYGSAKRG